MQMMLTGVEYDIEIQRADKGTNPKRARYHSSIMDAHLLTPREDFSKLPETYVIFITETDVLRDGLPIYIIERQIINTGKPFGDGEHIIYVNGECKNNLTELGKLMHDFFCVDPDDMHYQKLAEKVRYFKQNEKGVAAMCKVMEDMRNETIERERIEIAMDMIREGELPLEKIAKYSKLSLETVKELALQPAAAL